MSTKVIIQERSIESPLMAPWTSPISRALVVPRVVDVATGFKII